jgi:hypothetical protein
MGTRPFRTGYDVEGCVENGCHCHLLWVLKELFTAKLAKSAKIQKRFS